MKIFALPCAGGSSLMYNNFIKLNTFEFEFIPVEFAGRGVRGNERLYKDFNELVNDIYNVILHENKMNDDFCIFGHSMGGLVAYEICHKMQKDLVKKPNCLFVAAIPSPSEIDTLRFIGQMEDVELKNYIYKLGGINEKIIHNIAFEKVFFPIIKNDFKILTEYNLSVNSILNTNIVALYGKDDKFISSDLSKWMNYTTAKFIMKSLEGNHFFLENNESKILQIIQNCLNL